MSESRRIVYTPRAPGSLETADFSLQSAAAPVRDGEQVLLQPLYLSIDPYMVRLLKGQGSYFGRVAPGAAMRGRSISRVLESDAPQLRAGQVVLGETEWADRCWAPAQALTAIDEDSGIALSAWLGVAGHSGITAWAGMVDVAAAAHGETVVVSAASGAVGSVAGQLARVRGCRVVGIAGGPDKARHVVEDLGFHACVDYKSADFAGQLAAALPHGADVLFENVGGAVFDAVLPHLKRYARIALCGLVSQYAGPAQPLTLQHFDQLLNQAVRLQAFRVYDYLPRRDQILAQLVSLIRSGELRYRETVAQGLEAAPAALVAMMAGRNLGKQLVRL